MNFELKGFQEDVYTNYHLVSYFQEEEIGLKIPIATCTIRTTAEAINNISLDTEITISLDSTDGRVDNIAYTLKDFVVVTDIDGVNKIVTLFLIHKEREYVKEVEQRVYEDSSLEVMKQLLKKSDIDFEYLDFEGKDTYLKEGNNAQKWVRPNTSLKAFLKDLVKHTYLDKADSILSAITLKGFRISSMKTLLDESNKKVILVLSRENDEIADPYLIMQYETNNSLTTKKLKAKTDHVYNVVKDTLEVYDYKGVRELKDSETYPTNKISYVDNINCHDYWYSAEIRNKSAWLSLQATSLVIKLTDKNLRYDIDILDNVEILQSQEKANQGFEGRYVLAKKYIGLTKDENYTYLVLQRVPKGYFTEGFDND